LDRVFESFSTAAASRLFARRRVEDHPDVGGLPGLQVVLRGVRLRIAMPWTHISAIASTRALSCRCHAPPRVALPISPLEGFLKREPPSAEVFAHAAHSRLDPEPFQYISRRTAPLVQKAKGIFICSGRLSQISFRASASCAGESSLFVPVFRPRALGLSAALTAPQSRQLRDRHGAALFLAQADDLFPSFVKPLGRLPRIYAFHAPDDNKVIHQKNTIIAIFMCRVYKLIYA